MIPPMCSAPLKAWQGSAHAKDAWLRPKPCSDFSTFVQTLTHSLLVFEGPVLEPQKDQGPDRTGPI